MPNQCGNTSTSRLGCQQDKHGLFLRLLPRVHVGFAKMHVVSWHSPLRY